MSNAIAVVKYVNPPKDGRKASIKTEDGTTYQCKDHQIALFQQGRTYKIEYSGEREFNGKIYRHLESAAPVETQGGPSQTGATSPSMASYQGNGKDEQIFVCALLKELIRSGQVTNDKRQLWDATNMLRGLWRATFGDTNTFPASEAGKMARG